MYNFFFKETFPCGGEELIRRTMYDFSEYTKFAPNVTGIDIISREKQEDGREKIVVRVYVNVSLPGPVKAVFNFTEMDWKEHYIVDLENKTVDWKVETPVFTEYVDCGGTSYSNELPGGGSELVIKGSMNVRTPPMKGVPPSVVKGIIAMIEPFIGNMVTYNLKNYFKSVKACIAKEIKETGRVKFVAEK